MAVDLPREIALKILYDINEKGAYSNIALNKHLEAYDLKNIEKGFITGLVYGTVEWRLSIDWIIEKFSSVKLNKISPWILNILRLGVYQLVYTDKIPKSAACNECVNLSKKYGHSASSRYVNAVLRNVARNRNNIQYPDPTKEFEKFLAVKYSHPEWMVKTWVKRYGNDFTADLLKANNSIPDFSVRVNTLKISKDRLMDNLKESGIECENAKYIDEAIILKNPSSISRLEAFKMRYCIVQDESSMLVAKVLNPKHGELVMDVCSAPGGKAAHLAQLMENRGTVIARDIHEHKIKIIKDTALRLGLGIIKAELFDATVVDENYVDKADRVLVDAPCTGLGIIRRKPDIKWARGNNDKKEIEKLQMKILQTASKYVRVGGTITYSTCTIEPEENEGIINEFLTKNTNFHLEDISHELPQQLVKPGAREGMIQLYPNVDGIDGFFIARMKREVR